jgi:hypothetical protein
MTPPASSPPYKKYTILLTVNYRDVSRIEVERYHPGKALSADQIKLPIQI